MWVLISCVQINRNRYLQIYAQLISSVLFVFPLLEAPKYYDVAVDGDDVGGRKYDGAKPELAAAPK